MDIYTYEYDKSAGFTKEEIEAFIIAKDIKEKLDNNYQVFDKDTSLLRNIKYNDFSIIMDRATTFDLYKKIFNYFNIPITLLKDEKMESSIDILVINNLIKLLLKIKNKTIDKEFKYLFVSISRSFLFEIPDKEIFTYFENNNYKESKIYKESKKIIPLIDKMSIYEILNKILETFDYYNNYIKIGNITSGIVKITKLMESTKNLENLNYTLEDFSNYLTNILKKGYSIEYKVPDNGTNAVQIMTIHKSKGLEYPICYFSGLYKEFNISDLKERFQVDKKYGIIVPYFDEGISNTIYTSLIKKDFIEEEISEKIRLFYVALTRAREKIILVTPNKDKINNQDNNTVLDNNIKLNYRSFEDILLSIKNKTAKYYKNIDINNLALTKDYNFIKKIMIDDKIKKQDNMINVEEITIESNYIKNNTFSKKTNKLMKESTAKLMNYGTKLHEYLEYIDLVTPNLDLIEDDFCKEKIKAFLKQPFLKDINTATIYQEYEFIDKTSTNINHGIIDLMLEYPNHIDIIDYKLKNINDKNYKKQLEGYKKYIEKMTNKKINTYLYSLIDEKLEEIN